MRLGIPQDALIAGLVGRICRQKGVDTFVEAAVRLCPLLSKACFVVIGDAEDRKLASDLCQRIEKAGLSKRIAFKDHAEDIADIYAALDLLVAPSRWEGFGLVAAEAMAAGVPVIASDVGGLPAVLNDAGYMVPPEDANALCAAIERVLTDAATQKRMITVGKRQAARFDWSVVADRLSSIYKTVCT